MWFLLITTVEKPFKLFIDVQNGNCKNIKGKFSLFNAKTNGSSLSNNRNFLSLLKITKGFNAFEKIIH